MRTVVLGGFGNFGARICRALAGDAGLDVIACGRHPGSSPAIAGVSSAVLDVSAETFSRNLAGLAPDLVIHCAGPFQGQGYGVVRAALDAGANYLDLADGRDFVAGFAAANDGLARAADRFAAAGASTLPALSTAVIDALGLRLRAIEEIHIAIAPGQRAPRGRATLAGVLSYAGRPFRWLSGGQWRVAWGWQELRRVRFPFGTRWAAACDVPDLALLPVRHPDAHTVEFRAALEVAVQHFALWSLAMIRRSGAQVPIERLARPLERAAGSLNRFGSECGGMLVRLVGPGHDGRRRELEWQLTAPANNGPEIPCMAAILLARRLARGERLGPGAFPCAGFLRLDEFEPEFRRWAISTTVEERVA